MLIKEQVVQELDNLSETELRQVAEYLALLRFKARIRPMPEFDEAKLATLYTEFADEDRKLAEEGMSDYAKGLMKERNLYVNRRES